MFFAKNTGISNSSFKEKSLMKIPEIDNLHIYNRNRTSHWRTDILDYIRSSTMEYLEMYSFKNTEESIHVRYIVMQYLSNMLIFKVEDISKYSQIKGIFKKKKVILWNRLRQDLIETYNMSNSQMLKNHIRMTVFKYDDLFDKKPIKNQNFTDEEIQELNYLNIQELFKTKFALDQYSYLSEDIKVFNQSSKNDAFYEEMYNKIIKSFEKAETLNKEYLNTLNILRRKIREDKQLGILSRS